MNYRTEFEGKLRFVNKLTADQLTYLCKIIGEDVEKHPEWDSIDLSYIDLKLSDDLEGLEWNVARSTYNMIGIVNLVTIEMRKKYSDFRLTGKLRAKGEAEGDIWILEINREGYAIQVNVSLDAYTWERRFDWLISQPWFRLKLMSEFVMRNENNIDEWKDSFIKILDSKLN